MKVYQYKPVIIDGILEFISVGPLDLTSFVRISILRPGTFSKILFDVPYSICQKIKQFTAKALTQWPGSFDRTRHVWLIGHFRTLFDFKAEHFPLHPFEFNHSNLCFHPVYLWIQPTHLWIHPRYLFCWQDFINPQVVQEPTFRIIHFWDLMFFWYLHNIRAIVHLSRTYFYSDKKPLEGSLELKCKWTSIIPQSNSNKSLLREPKKSPSRIHFDWLNSLVSFIENSKPSLGDHICFVTYPQTDLSI